MKVVPSAASALLMASWKIGSNFSPLFSGFMVTNGPMAPLSSSTTRASWRAGVGVGGVGPAADLKESIVAIDVEALELLSSLVPIRKPVTSDLAGQMWHVSSTRVSPALRDQVLRVFGVPGRRVAERIDRQDRHARTRERLAQLVDQHVDLEAPGGKQAVKGHAEV